MTLFSFSVFIVMISLCRALLPLKLPVQPSLLKNRQQPIRLKREKLEQKANPRKHFWLMRLLKKKQLLCSVRSM